MFVIAKLVRFSHSSPSVLGNWKATRGTPIKVTAEPPNRDSGQLPSSDLTARGGKWPGREPNPVQVPPRPGLIYGNRPPEVEIGLGRGF
jgi:hypothetical protein